MEKVQRLNGNGLMNLYIGSRDSLNPIERLINCKQCIPTILGYIVENW